LCPNWISWCGPPGLPGERSLRNAQRIFAEAERRHLYLALANLPVEFFDLSAASMERDRDTITCLRSVLMKPDHREWVDDIWTILDQATHAVLASR